MRQDVTAENITAEIRKAMDAKFPQAEIDEDHPERRLHIINVDNVRITIES